MSKLSQIFFAISLLWLTACTQFNLFSRFSDRDNDPLSLSHTLANRHLDTRGNVITHSSATPSLTTTPSPSSTPSPRPTATPMPTATRESFARTTLIATRITTETAFRLDTMDSYGLSLAWAPDCFCQSKSVTTLYNHRGQLPFNQSSSRMRTRAWSRAGFSSGGIDHSRSVAAALVGQHIRHRHQPGLTRATAAQGSPPASITDGIPT